MCRRWREYCCGEQATSDRRRRESGAGCRGTPGKSAPACRHLCGRWRERPARSRVRRLRGRSRIAAELIYRRAAPRAFCRGNWRRRLCLEWSARFAEPAPSRRSGTSRKSASSCSSDADTPSLPRGRWCIRDRRGRWTCVWRDRRADSCPTRISFPDRRGRPGSPGRRQGPAKPRAE